MIFICHSTEDKPFVKRLTARLIEERVHIWLDDMEIKVGESLIDKIEDGLGKMDYLAIVLTPRSVASSWCREELKAALSRQIKTRRTVVLPLLVEDCELPPFLQEKKYANFKNDFESGLQELLTAINSSVDLSAGKSDSDDFVTDFAWDYGLAEPDSEFAYEHWSSHVDAVSFAKHGSFSVMCRANLRANDVLTRRYMLYVKAGLPEVGSAIMLGMIGGILDDNENRAIIDKGARVEQNVGIEDPRTGALTLVQIEMRRLGEPVEHVIFHWGTIFSGAFESVRKRAEAMSPREKAKVAEILRSPW